MKQNLTWLETAANRRMHTTTNQIYAVVYGKDRRGRETVGERRGGLHSVVLGQSSWEGGENIIIEAKIKLIIFLAGFCI